MATPARFDIAEEYFVPREHARRPTRALRDDERAHVGRAFPTGSITLVGQLSRRNFFKWRRSSNERAAD